MKLTYIGGLEEQNSGKINLLVNSINNDFESCLKIVETTLINTGVLDPNNFNVSDMNIVADYEISILGLNQETKQAIINFDNQNEPIYLAYQETVIPDEPKFVNASISSDRNDCEKKANYILNQQSQARYHDLQFLKFNPDIINYFRN